MSDPRKVSLPTSFNPMNYGGVVAKQSRTEEQVKEKFLLPDSPSFLSRYSLPDVPQFAKIVAVCGIPDWSSNNEFNPSEGMAAPNQDGWFHSDFYLMHHLFKGVSPEQQWLTSVDPKVLVQKYKQYVHGSPGELHWDTKERLSDDTRRVVLDEEILKSGDLRDVQVIRPDYLSQAFSNAIRKAVQDGEKQDRPVLIMIFSHGLEDCKVFLGGSPECEVYFGVEDLQKAIGKPSSSSKRRICLLTSACYSGGWAINPSYDLQFSTIAAAQPWDMSAAWPPSETINKRTAGSPFVSAITELFAQVSIEGLGEMSADILKDVSFTGFTKVMSRTMQRIDPRPTPWAESPHNPMFSSQGDEWQKSVSDRVGIDLSLFRDKWSTLKAAAGYQPPPSNREGDTSTCRLAPTERLFTYDQMVLLVIREAKEYFNSFPGSDSAGPNVAFHNQLHILIDGNSYKGKQMSIGLLKSLHHVLDYRMNRIMGAATAFKNFLRIEGMPACTETDLHEWPGNDKWSAIRSLVKSYNLFDKPGSQEGRIIYKGEDYITACIVHSGWNKETAITKLDSLVTYRNPGYKSISRVSNTSRNAFTLDHYHFATDKTVRDALKSFANSVKKRSRQLSPIRRQRGRIPSYMVREAEAGEASGSAQ